MKINLNNIKDKVMDKITKIDRDDILAATVGVSLGLFVVCIMQQNQIGNLQKLVKSTEDFNTTRFKLATNNDYKLYNQFVWSKAAIEAITDSIKGTHPGVVTAVEEAINNAQYLEIPYPEVDGLTYP